MFTWLENNIEITVYRRTALISLQKIIYSIRWISSALYSFEAKCCRRYSVFYFAQLFALSNKNDYKVWLQQDIIYLFFPRKILNFIQKATSFNLIDNYKGTVLWFVLIHRYFLRNLSSITTHVRGTLRELHQ